MSGERNDPWARFRGATRARIALGRSGDALPTTALLEFQLAHARARDAVHGAVDFGRLAADLAPLETVRVRSAAADRATYLRRPDLGRRLDPASAASLPAGDWDLLFVIADGLSAAAVQANAAPLVQACLTRLGGLRIGPVVLAEQARVALGDEAASRMGARLVALLVGERPGLSAAESLGVYLTWDPKPGRADSERNCISNIHSDGLSIAAAADKLCWLATEAARLKLTGVALKEDAPSLSGHDNHNNPRIGRP
ncbi:ethanolamine ammonia-lyase subunit EutC [Azospirillum picis]|uniref:Ethanolamine ammonia-lyase small subunit n=1 Tax=Azospirillum picis TaxID=488438 RepID=A0ABU0MDL6_9PROT|nr:ethanolamine ammonia-lyase subunit EutC [Azospirillum picis]MBP2297456.1 ethanolamine ammonia-lyase small subunit [Azospirillum picis]MDQ0531521.1 ethanolamine ammonia-lyase small subunit [Azospirillum picis]